MNRYPESYCKNTKRALWISSQKSGSQVLPECVDNIVSNITIALASLVLCISAAAVERVLPTTIEETAFRGRIESPGFGCAPPIHAGPRPESIGGPARRRSTYDRGASLAPIRFPPDNFKHSLTLFSKSFSSFPRGTCSLSVSRPYFALDGIHRSIWPAFPNNPTRRHRLVGRQGPGTTGLSPSPAPPSRGLGPGPPLRTLLQTTIRTTEPPDSKAGLFPVRSPLLGESS
ncbi:hypothetical protein RND71_032308 [Anisodus tanguticus]|uniref:Protein TAR1 n=1 Tax=Anisodus tanguticus TaxID=243964 RepID=A0AAE1UYA4_9SOLA|nr:hypothetical protein RND71_032308 [Anisodus tanguticus]